MAETVVRILASEGAVPPSYASGGSAGADLHAFLPATMSLGPGERAAVPTGLRIELPAGYEAQVRPRSGLALDKGITCLNSPGTIDSDYRGEVKVILVNLGTEKVEIKNGDRIAQLVVARAERVAFEPAPSLGETGRGSGGFGSTGR